MRATIESLDDFLSAMKSRHDFFHKMGGRLSDHGIERCFFAETDEASVEAIFKKARMGGAATADEKEQFGFYLARVWPLECRERLGDAAAYWSTEK